MGAILQIRVAAVTFDPGKVERTWPGLVKLAWPVEATPPQGEPGVLELVAGLHDRLVFGDLVPPVRMSLEPGILRVAALGNRLEQALADRDPQTADALSYRIEDALSELEGRLG